MCFKNPLNVHENELIHAQFALFKVGQLEIIVHTP